MVLDPTWFLVAAAWTVEVLLFLYVRATRQLVQKALSIVAPWLVDGDEEDSPIGAGTTEARIPIRDKRGRIKRWERVSVPAGATAFRGQGVDRGETTDAEGNPLGGGDMEGVPVAELLQKFSDGKLHKSDVMPYLPQIMAKLKSEYQAPGSDGGSSQSNVRSRF